MTYEEFATEIQLLTDINLTLYKEKQMKRRINTLIERLGLDSYDSYLKRLRNDPVSLEHFLGYITINVTEFFRTQDQWNYVADNVLANLPDNAIIWSCACASGEESYSLAISIALRRPLGNIKIIATDIDDQVLSVARRGEYTQRTMANVYESCVHKFFTHSDENCGHSIQNCEVYKICDEIRNHVEFQHLNLLSDSFPQNCNLIVCRNVLIYFTDQTKDKLYHQFYESLCPGGYLFTGHTEQILKYREFKFKKEKNFLFQKP